MKSGFDENTSFKKTEDLFQERIQRKIDAL